MGLKLNIGGKPAERPAPVVDETIPAVPPSFIDKFTSYGPKPQDLDPKPGPLSAAALASKGPITNAKAVCFEMNAAMNRLTYWMIFGDWFVVSKRTEVIWHAARDQDWTTFRGALQQFWDIYVEVMKQPRWKWTPNGYEKL